MASYSQLVDSSDLFAPWEMTIGSWGELQQRLTELSERYPYVRPVWRGQGDANWGVFSSLARAVQDELNRAATEEDLIATEKRLLRLARIDYRLDGIPAMELFAKMQHIGAPTRLIDVTMNPLIATWFVVAGDESVAEKDGRLLAFTEPRGKSLQLNSLWNGNTPRWHRLRSDAERIQENWGTGLGRWVWRPPAYHARIPAQSAGFLLDGVPIDYPEAETFGRARPGVYEYRRATELRTFASIPMHLRNLTHDRLPVQNGPVFTYRISAKAKPAIRAQLEERFGYSHASIYADIEGLAEYVRYHRAEFIKG